MSSVRTKHIKKAGINTVKSQDLSDLKISIINWLFTQQVKEYEDHQQA